MSTLLSVGTQAPLFTLPNQNGESVSLDDFRGQWVVLYFYPKALTPGCTTQACDIRDHKKVLADLNAVVLGVSTDTVKKLKSFEEKKELNFTLLSDEKHSVAESYGTWDQKTLYGKIFMGTLRVTYIINPAGEIAHVFPKVNAAKHLAEVTHTLQTLQNK